MAGIELEMGIRSGAAQARDPGAPFIILVAGAFHGAGDPGPLSGRRPRAIDIDNFDEVLARVSPALALADGGTLGFTELEEFHADSLLQRHPELRDLRELRQRLGGGASFEAAAAELRARLGTPAAAAGAEPAPLQAVAESTADTLGRLLGEAPPAARGQRAADAVSRLIRDAVAGHIRPEDPPELAVYQAAAEEAMSEALRAVIHAPDFRRLEALWLGLHRLLTQIETGAECQVKLLCVDREEWADPLLASRLASDEAYAGISVCVCTEQWGLADLEVLLAVARAGAAAAVPVLSGVRAEVIVGGEGGLLGEPAHWPQPGADWQALRADAAAAWLGLFTPALLLRQPYGERSDPVDGLRFEEWQGRHSDLLWGSPALGAAECLGRAYNRAGWSMAADDVREIEDLPAHHFVEDGESRMVPVAGAWLTETVSDAILERGIVPLVSERNGNRARMPRLQSVANPLAALRGPWS